MARDVEMRYTRVNWGERDTFEHDFRMKRQTFHLLLEILKFHISGNDRMEGVRASVDAETRLAVALFWYASSGSTQDNFSAKIPCHFEMEK